MDGILKLWRFLGQNEINHVVVGPFWTNPVDEVVIFYWGQTMELLITSQIVILGYIDIALMKTGMGNKEIKTITD
jgi:hypothetical protein